MATYKVFKYSFIKGGLSARGIGLIVGGLLIALGKREELIVLVELLLVRQLYAWKAQALVVVHSND